MNIKLKKVITATSALLMALSVGAGINNINVNAKRKSKKTTRIIKHKYNKRVRKYHRRSTRNYTNEYNKGFKMGEKEYFSYFGNIDKTGGGGLNEPHVRAALINNHNNKRYLNGLYKGIDKLYKDDVIGKEGLPLKNPQKSRKSMLNEVKLDSKIVKLLSSKSKTARKISYYYIRNIKNEEGTDISGIIPKKYHNYKLYKQIYKLEKQGYKQEDNIAQYK